MTEQQKILSASERIAEHRKRLSKTSPSIAVKDLTDRELQFAFGQVAGTLVGWDGNPTNRML